MKLYTARGAAWHKGCGRTTILRAVESGELPHIRAIGTYGERTTVLIRESDLDKWWPKKVGYQGSAEA